MENTFTVLVESSLSTSILSKCYFGPIANTFTVVVESSLSTYILFKCCFGPIANTFGPNLSRSLACCLHSALFIQPRSSQWFWTTLPLAQTNRKTGPSFCGHKYLGSNSAHKYDRRKQIAARGELGGLCIQ